VGPLHSSVFSTLPGLPPLADVFWQALVTTRARNIRVKRRNASRYPRELHDFSFVLAFMSKSASTHSFVANTLYGALPSRRHVLDTRLAHSDVLVEPGFQLSRASAAARFYGRLGYTGPFTTSEDGTACREEATVRMRDYAILGLCTLAAVVTGDTLQEMIAALVTHGLARQVAVLLLNPLDTRLPSFVLGVFPQRSTACASVLKERWGLLRPLLDAVGVHVVGHGADGDAAQLRALLDRADSAALGDKAFSFHQVPSIIGPAFHVSAPARPLSLPRLDVPDLGFEDCVHLALKLRGRILNRNGAGVWLGDGVASLRTLQAALADQASARVEINLGLRKSDLNPVDRMNYPAVQRLLQPTVREFLALLPAVVPPSASASTTSVGQTAPIRPAPTPRHLSAFLNFAESAVFAFLGSGNAYERLFHAWFARYFADGWRAWLVEKRLSLSENFLTSNQYSCIVLNANSLLLFYHWLCSHPALRLHVPAGAFAFGSQQNENNFREMRCGQDCNFTVEAFLRRQTLWQEFSIIRTERANMFTWAQHHKHVHSDNIRRAPEYLSPDYTETVARACLTAAVEAARVALAALGIVVPVSHAAAPPPLLSDREPCDVEDEAVDALHAVMIEDAEGDELPVAPTSAGGDVEELSEDEEHWPDALPEEEEEEASGGQREGAATLLQLGGSVDLHFSERTTVIQAQQRSATVRDVVTGQDIHKQRAVAMLSGRGKQSSDRISRVRASAAAEGIRV